jgi:hypothetical protein
MLDISPEKGLLVSYLDRERFEIGNIPFRVLEKLKVEFPRKE